MGVTTSTREGCQAVAVKTQAGQVSSDFLRRASRFVGCICLFPAPESCRYADGTPRAGPEDIGVSAPKGC
jgi:hypothetical protein